MTPGRRQEQTVVMGACSKNPGDGAGGGSRIHPWSSQMIEPHLSIKPRTVHGLVAQAVKSLPTVRETWVPYLGQEDPLEKGDGNPLQYSCLENPVDRGAWWATVHGVESIGHD